MLKRADEIVHPYFRLRSKALVSLFDLTGKRRIRNSEKLSESMDLGCRELGPFVKEYVELILEKFGTSAQD